MNYVNFDLVLVPVGDRYRVEVASSPAGAAAAEFQLPFSDQELKIFRLEATQPRRGVRRMESSEMRTARQFGARLFETIFAGEVKDRLFASLDQAEGSSSGLRLRLDLSRAPQLADLPWEYLYDPERNRFFSLSISTPLVRYLDLPERIRPLSVKPPVRVLAVIASPADRPPLDVEGEWNRLSSALAPLTRDGMVELDRLPVPTYEALLKRLRQKPYHIFHFVGHGEFNEDCNEGMLLFEDPDRQGAPVSAQALGTLLHDEPSLRLAILNACEGARTSSADPFAGTAQTLLQQGIPAVIAMQAAITDDAAQKLAFTFYDAIADGYPVDAALTDARKSIFGNASAEFGTPVLYMRSPDGRIFDVDRVSKEIRRREQRAELSRHAEEMIAVRNWTEAISALETRSALDPEDTGTATRLPHARLQKRLDELVSAARDRLDAGRWREALDGLSDARRLGSDSPDLPELISTAEAGLSSAASIPTERKQGQPTGLSGEDASGRPRGLAGAVRVADLYHAAESAVSRRDWRGAAERFDEILKIDPAHAEARSGLDRARRELETEDHRAASVAKPAEPARRRFSTYLKIGGCSIAAAATLCTVLVVGIVVRQRASGRAVAARSTSAEKPAAVSAETESVPPAPEAKSSTEPKTSSEERVLRSVVREATEAEIQAARWLNPAALSRIFTGLALASELATLQALSTSGTYAVARLESQNVDGFQVSPDGGRAEIRVQETWTVRFFYVLNGACAGEWPTYPMARTYFLMRVGSGWMVDNLQNRNQPPPMQPCR